tara:strand:- start:1838 stop:2236 length:399 start_codon:yes stop_codon:yes gene_type:complete
MANTVTETIHSPSVKTLLIENTETAFSGTTVMISTEDIALYDRATIQIRNEGEGATITAKVWGSLFDSADATPATNSKWVQVGDDISIANNTGALKAISTTGLRYIAITMTIASGTPTFNAGNCKIFLQGTI